MVRNNQMTDKLGMALSKLLFQMEPGLLEADLDASARAAAEVSALLGCIMATVLIKNPQEYPTAFKAVAQRIHDQAHKTAEQAFDLRPNTTAH